MTYFISGGAKCGKSSLAQDLSVALSKGGKHYYVATLIPSGSEDHDRIRQHLADREGMGFETVECFRNIMDCLKIADKNGVFLVDSVTSLIQNSLWRARNDLFHIRWCEMREILFGTGLVGGSVQRRKTLLCGYPNS